MLIPKTRQTLKRRQVVPAGGLPPATSAGRSREQAAADLAERPQPAAAPTAPPLPPLAAIALGRLTFGPRPGTFDYGTFNALPGATDAAKLASFVDWQLAPDAIDDTACQARINAANLPTLTKSLTQLWADHHEAQSGDRVQPGSRSVRGDLSAGHLQPAAVVRADGGFLAQPLQRVRLGLRVRQRHLGPLRPQRHPRHTRWATSARCLKRSPPARRCCSTWTTT